MLGMIGARLHCTNYAGTVKKGPHLSSNQSNCWFVMLQNYWLLEIVGDSFHCNMFQGMHGGTGHDFWKRTKETWNGKWNSLILTGPRIGCDLPWHYSNQSKGLYRFSVRSCKRIHLRLAASLSKPTCDSGSSSWQFLGCVVTNDAVQSLSEEVEHQNTPAPTQDSLYQHRSRSPFLVGMQQSVTCEESGGCYPKKGKISLPHWRQVKRESRLALLPCAVMEIGTIWS